MNEVVILDYGMGNLGSVRKALRYLGVPCKISSTLEKVDKLLIPGVGAFGPAMEKLLPLQSQIKHFAEKGMPILGICLGQQLLFERSEENGTHTGLGLIAGSVRYLRGGVGIKIPHIGWNKLELKQPSHPLVRNISSDAQVYFVHSLFTLCQNDNCIVATSCHGNDFAAIVAENNIWGCQFHPEKSGEVGLEMLKAFAHL